MSAASKIANIDSYYHRTVSRSVERPELDITTTTETCVIGGGLAGVATMLGLSERGRPVTLLEAKTIGCGASGLNGGFLSSGFSLGARSIEKKIGRNGAKELYSMSVEAVNLIKQRAKIYKIDCISFPEGIVRNSWFNASKCIRDEIDYMNTFFDTELLYWSPEKVKGSYLSPRYHDAVFNPNGYQIHSLNYANGCAEAAESQGAKIFENTSAIKIHKKGGTYHIKTNKGQVSADNVVICVSSEIRKLNKKLYWSILPISTFMVLTEPLGNRLKDAIRVPYAASDNRRIENYYRVLKDTRLLWGGGMSISHNPKNLPDKMMSDLFYVYPQLKGLKSQLAWSGKMGYARHHMPQIGRLKSGFWYNQAFGGHGINTTTLGGELIARAIANNESDYVIFGGFGLDFAGGPLGLLAAQSLYWSRKIKDRLDSW